MRTVSLLMILAALAACSKPPPPPAPSAVSVTVLPAALESIRDYEILPGRIEAPETVVVEPRVRGHLAQVHFTEGSEVRAGDLLYTIDPREFQALSQVTSAELDRARARLAQAKSDLDRARRLDSQTAISRQELEGRITATSEAEAAVRSAQAAREKAEIDLGFTRIEAPISGKIGRTLVTSGNVVGPGTRLAEIVSQDPLFAYFEIPERLLSRWVAKGGSSHELEAAIGLPQEDGFPREGRIDFSDNAIRRETGTLLARAVIDNANRGLRPGMAARVRLSMNKPRDAVMIPETALLVDQGERYVFVVTDGKAQWRRVLPGFKDGDRREIVEGLDPGEMVAIDHLHLLRNGMPVKVRGAGS